ncbi:MAG TPA: alpha/beta hydrolase, partial [Ottowia sp.]|nr:alpha/beta hydrolase [Ottowia sp.]
WKVPTLLLYAGHDRAVSPAGSEAFARAAPADCVTVRAFPLHYHELFNDLDNDAVFAVLRDWLTTSFAPVALGRAAPF